MQKHFMKNKKEDKDMRKLMAMVLALTLVLTLAAPVMATADDLEEITILYPGEETAVPGTGADAGADPGRAAAGAG